MTATLPGCESGAPDGLPNRAAVVVICPSDLQVPVSTEAVLVASHDVQAVRTGWVAVSAPTGSTAQPDPPEGDTATLLPLLPGGYTLRYSAEDDAGHVSSCEVSLTATVEDDFRVDILWNTDTPVSDDLADLDLHILHPTGAAWFDADSTGLDCYWENPAAAWGLSGIEDDPTLDFDDPEGRGPESIEIATPEEDAGAYRVGVHYYDDNGFGPSTVTVNIYCHGELARSFGSQVLATADEDPANDFWKVADVSFGAARCTITELGGGVPVIVSTSDARMAR